MRSRFPQTPRRRAIGLVALAGVAAITAGTLSATESSAAQGTWGIDVGGDLSGWYADTKNAPSVVVNHHEADLRTSSSSARINLSHPSVPAGTPEHIYKTQRAVRPGAPMTWAIPTPGGAHTVRLHFAENRDRFFTVGGTVTDIYVNGQLAIDDLDVFAEVGANKALVRELPVSGRGSMITFEAEAGWPSLAAIEVVGGDLTNLEDWAFGTWDPSEPAAPAPTDPTVAPEPTTPETTTPPPSPEPTTPPTTPKPTTPPTTAPAPAQPEVGRALSFRPPALTNPTTIQVSNTNRALRLDDTKDYIIKMPSTPLDSSGGLNISGGRNVVLIGGHIHFSKWYTGASIGKVNRGMYLQNQTGTLHVEGLLISGNVGEGINLSQTKGGVVQLQNIRIEGATGSQAGNHADLIQSWAGPRKLLIDGFSGSTNYQGFFLLPNQWFDGPAPELFDFRNVNLSGDPAGAGYMLWVDETRQRFPVRHQNVWAKPSASKTGNPDQFLWPRPSTGDTTWKGVREGTPPGGDIVPRSLPGVNYRSPGYAN